MPVLMTPGLSLLKHLTRKNMFSVNDLSQPNIVVDPESSKMQAIIDWDYAGFFPENF